MQERVLQHRTVPIGEHEAIAVGPLWIDRIELQEIVPQHFGDVGHAHRHAWMAAIGGFDRVHSEGTDGVGEFATGGHRGESPILRGLKNGIVADRYSAVALVICGAPCFSGSELTKP